MALPRDHLHRLLLWLLLARLVLGCNGCGRCRLSITLLRQGLVLQLLTPLDPVLKLFFDTLYFGSFLRRRYSLLLHYLWLLVYLIALISSVFENDLADRSVLVGNQATVLICHLGLSDCEICLLEVCDLGVLLNLKAVARHHESVTDHGGRRRMLLLFVD